MFQLQVHFPGHAAGSPKQFRVRGGQTLLEALLQHDIPLRHDCGGVCHCTTCHIHVQAGADFLEEPGRRELDFLNRVPARSTGSRLACQCLIRPGRGTISIQLPPDPGSREPAEERPF